MVSNRRIAADFSLSTYRPANVPTYLPSSPKKQANFLPTYLSSLKIRWPRAYLPTPAKYWTVPTTLKKNETQKLTTHLSVLRFSNSATRFLVDLPKGADHVFLDILLCFVFETRDLREIRLS